MGTYTINSDNSITCHRCGKRSHNVNDVVHRYCGHCHIFHEAPKTVRDITLEPPDDEWVKTVCKVGKGSDCCRYLTMSPGGWSCEKHTSLSVLLDNRVAMETITARGDNCLGKGERRR